MDKEWLFFSWKMKFFIKKKKKTLALFSSYNNKSNECIFSLIKESFSGKKKKVELVENY